MDGFIDLFSELVVQAGMLTDLIFRRKAGCVRGRATLNQQLWLGRALCQDSVIIKLYRIRCLFLLCIRLLLFLQFLNEPAETLRVSRGEPIFMAEVQVVAEPFLVNAMQPLWN